MRLIFKLAVLAATLGLAACAHHRDVRPGADGIHRVRLSSEDKEEGTRDAIEQANHYCGEMKKSAAFIDENTKYTGDMNEKDYKTLKTASKVAKTAGGTVWAMGGEKESNIGGIVGLGGTVADQVAGKGYTVEMKFKCQ